MPQMDDERVELSQQDNSPDPLLGFFQIIPISPTHRAKLMGGREEKKKDEFKQNKTLSLERTPSGDAN